MAKRIFMTGGSGFLGSALAAGYLARGDKVVVLSSDRRRAEKQLGSAVELVEGDATAPGEWQEALSGADVVVNLAGQSIAGKRWNARYKQILHDSRVDTTRFVVEGIARLAPERRPAVLLSASGIDYYPFAVDLGAVFDFDDEDGVIEGAPRGDSVLARVCRDWEAEANQASKLGVRVALMRMGIILGHGGALAQMSKPFKLFFGGRIGHGRQWVSWVHLDDAVAAYLFASDRETATGPLNLVAPRPVRNVELARALGKALHRPSFVPTPAFAVRAMVGEFADYLLEGRRALPARLEELGFEFRFPDITGALADLYG